MPDLGSVIDWLLDSDPSIRWQVMRDLLDAPQPMWTAERVRVESEGWGAGLLSHQDEDGQWAGGTFVPAGFDPREWRELGQPWTATCFSLSGLGSKLDTSAIIGKVSKWRTATFNAVTSMSACAPMRTSPLRPTLGAKQTFKMREGHVHFRAVYGRLSVGKGFFERSAVAGWCGHVSDL